MGLQLNLTQLLGLPDHTQCPRCLKRIPSLYDHVDVEAMDFNPSQAKINIPHYCCICEHEWIATYTIKATLQSPPPPNHKPNPEPYDLSDDTFYYPPR